VRYEKELAQNVELFNILEQKSSETTVIRVFAAHDIRHNSASVLKRIIEEKLKNS
jgi:uncharacterized protein YeaO (DUF488 family)